MDFLYLTADKIGADTGGGQVTANEWQAMRELPVALDGDPCGTNLTSEAWSFPDAPRPWGSDEQAAARLHADPSIRPLLAHIYAGCFTETVRELQRRGCKVVYTVAAHDRHVSREEHEKLGLPFPYPHLVDDALFAHYSGGYREADVVVAPGEAPKRVLIADGVDPAKIRIIPHGHEPPHEVKPLPKRFAVGYLGSPGVDKGLRYLLEAWKILNYSDALLTIAGPGTEHIHGWVRQFGGGNVYLRGWVKSPSLLYNSVSLYVQPSATEGFGIEVVEAMAHGRPVACSDGAGAAAFSYFHVPPRDARALADGIERFRALSSDAIAKQGNICREQSALLTWPRIREWYRALWRSVLA